MFTPRVQDFGGFSFSDPSVFFIPAQEVVCMKAHPPYFCSLRSKSIVTCLHNPVSHFYSTAWRLGFPSCTQYKGLHACRPQPPADIKYFRAVCNLVRIGKT